MKLSYAPYSTINATSLVKSLDYLTYGYADIFFNYSGVLSLTPNGVPITEDFTYTSSPYIEPSHTVKSFLNIYYTNDFMMFSSGNDLYGGNGVYKVFGNSTYSDYFGPSTPSAQPSPLNFIKVYIGVMKYNRVSGYVDTDLNAQVLASKEIPELANDCFEWYQLQPGYGVPTDFKTQGPYIIKYKYVVNAQGLADWFQSNIMPIVGSTYSNVFRLVHHLPYIYKLNTRKPVSVIYPSSSTKLKVLDKVIIDTGINFTKTIKKYTIQFIDLETNNLLLQYNTVRDYKLFGLPYISEAEYLTEQYSDQYKDIRQQKLLRLSIPDTDQKILFDNRKYYILIKSTDLIG